MVNVEGARTRRDGRRQRTTEEYLDKTRSEGRDVKTTGGAHARRGVVCWFWRMDIYPTPNVVRDGGTEMLSVMDMLAGSGKLLERTRREGRGNG